MVIQLVSILLLMVLPTNPSTRLAPANGQRSQTHVSISSKGHIWPVSVDGIYLGANQIDAQKQLKFPLNSAASEDVKLYDTRASTIVGYLDGRVHAVSGSEVSIEGKRVRIGDKTADVMIVYGRPRRQASNSLLYRYQYSSTYITVSFDIRHHKVSEILAIAIWPRRSLTEGSQITVYGPLSAVYCQSSPAKQP